jgi:hypothetical protein
MCGKDPSASGFGTTSAAHTPCMDLRRPLLVLALVGSLTACGDNTDVQRGETNCDSTATSANNPHDASCDETGKNEGNPN